MLKSIKTLTRLCECEHVQAILKHLRRFLFQNSFQPFKTKRNKLKWRSSSNKRELSDTKMYKSCHKNKTFGKTLQFWKRSSYFKPEKGFGSKTLLSMLKSRSACHVKNIKTPGKSLQVYVSPNQTNYFRKFIRFHQKGILNCEQI